MFTTLFFCLQNLPACHHYTEPLSHTGPASLMSFAAPESCLIVFGSEQKSALVKFEGHGGQQDGGVH